MAADDTENTVAQSPQVPVYNVIWKAMPKDRNNYAIWASRATFAIATILVLIFCYTTRYMDEYTKDTTSNTTNVCYRKKETLAFPGLFTAALGLFSIVVGTLVDRLSLVVEECRHVPERYDGSYKKMFKACFSGIHWGPVFMFMFLSFVIVILMIFLAGFPWFELRYLVYIFSGISVGPLVMHLLNLNTQSKVQISTIIEENWLFVAHGLAWSYYFNHLKYALKEFKKAISTPFPSQHRKIKLSLDKLILLIPLDCSMRDDLQAVDSNITCLFQIGQDPYLFSVYGLQVDQQVEYFAIQYAKEPLQTLLDMRWCDGVETIKRKNCEGEVKLLLKTLSHILQDPPHDENRETCLLVPYKVASLASLNNGGLVKFIMKEAKSSSVQVDVDGTSKPKAGGYMKLEENTIQAVDLDEKPKEKVKKPQGSELGSSSTAVTRYQPSTNNEEIDGSTLKDEIFDPNSHIDRQEVGDDDHSSEVQLKRTYKGKSNQTEQQLSVDVHKKASAKSTTDNQTQTEANDEEVFHLGGIGNGQPSRNYVNVVENNPRIENDKQLVTRDDQPPSDHLNEIGNEQPSNNSVNVVENNPRNDNDTCKRAPAL